MGKQHNKSNKRPRPLVPMMMGGGDTTANNTNGLLLRSSRKKARKITTLFHKYTHQKEQLLLQQQQQQQQNGTVRTDNDDSNDTTTTGTTTSSPSCSNTKLQEKINELDDKIEQMGGRRLYQRASQISTSYHSTSKWVLGFLAQNGWLYGIRTTTNCSNHSSNDDDCIHNNDTIASKIIQTNNNNNRNDDSSNVDDDDDDDEDDNKSMKEQRELLKQCNTVQQQKRKQQRRITKILEVGAINTELLDTADASVTVDGSNGGDATTIPIMKKKYNITVRAIDLHSMVPGRIEEHDFLTFPLQRLYDVIVCSMVLNCVPTPQQRFIMLQQLYHHLNYDNTTATGTSDDTRARNDRTGYSGGLCFLTIPKTCLTLSPYIDIEQFNDLLVNFIGFEILHHTKTSPKILYYILRRRTNVVVSSSTSMKPKWRTQQTIIRRGKKYRNNFDIIIPTTHDDKTSREGNNKR